MRPDSLLRTLVLLGVLCTVTAPLAAGPAPGETKVHLDKAEALTQVFPDADQVVELRYVLSRDELERIEERMDRRLDEGGFYLYAGLVDGKPIGFAAIVSQVGKVKPITHIVGVTPDGRVSGVAVMIYRESHGDEVADERFMEQYRGMTLEDPIRINRDVINIAGATLSGHAICRGVRKALAVVDEVFLRKDADELLALIADAETVTPAALQRAGADPDETAGLRREREVMGSVCSIHAFGADGAVEGDALASAVEAALEEVSRWDDVLSNWRGDTPLSRVNATPAGEPCPTEADLLAWLEDAIRWSDATGGRFDPGVGSLVLAWDLQSGHPSRPSESALLAARQAVGMDRFVVDRDLQTIVRLDDRALLDPGASGKGFALDRAAAVLRRHGVERALLSFRSTLLAMGPPPGESAWRVPVVHDGAGDQVALVELVHGALSVSGGALRAFDDDGTLRGHVLDPRSGVPVEASRLAWVQHASAAASDALATALLVSGPHLQAVPGATGAFLQDARATLRPWPTSP